MQTRLLFKEFLRFRREMNFVAIPEQKDGTWHEPQNLFQENDDLFRTQVALKRAHTQTDFAQFWTDQQRAQEIEPLVMIQAGPRRWRLSAWRPAPLERRHQREACFIY